MKKKILKTIYSVGGFKPFHYLNRNDALILTYHRFSEEPGPRSVSSGQFEEHLKYLRKNTNVLPLGELVGKLREGREVPPNSTAITIDDGYLDAYQIAYPLLREYDLPATLYAITGFVSGKIWLWTDKMRFVLSRTKEKSLETQINGIMVSGQIGGSFERSELAERLNGLLKKLDDDEKDRKIDELADKLGIEIPNAPSNGFDAINWDQAREMDSTGIAIECHTVNHPMLTKIGNDRLVDELADSRKAIEKEIGRPSDHFCYPNGDFDESVRDAVEDAGFESAVTTSYGFCDAETDLFRLNRIDGQPAISSFAQSVSGFELIRERIGI